MSEDVDSVSIDVEVKGAAKAVGELGAVEAAEDKLGHKQITNAKELQKAIDDATKSSKKSAEAAETSSAKHDNAFTRLHQNFRQMETDYESTLNRLGLRSQDLVRRNRSVGDSFQDFHKRIGESDRLLSESRSNALRMSPSHPDFEKTLAKYKALHAENIQLHKDWSVIQRMWGSGVEDDALSRLGLRVQDLIKNHRTLGDSFQHVHKQIKESDRHLKSTGNAASKMSPSHPNFETTLKSYKDLHIANQQLHKDWSDIQKMWGPEITRKLDTPFNKMHKKFHELGKAAKKMGSGFEKLETTFLSMFQTWTQLSQSFLSGISTMGNLANLATLAATGLSLLGPAAELAGGGIVAGLAVAPGILAGITSGGLAAYLGLQNVTTALSTIMDESKFNKYTTFAQRRQAYTAWHGALANMAPAAQTFVTRLQNMIPFMRTLEKSVQGAAFPAFSQALTNLAPVMSQLGPTLTAAARGFGEFVDKATAFMGGSGFSKMKTIFAEGHQFMSSVGNALNTFAQAEITLGASGAGKSAIGRLGGWINHIANAFSKFVNNGGAKKAIGDYFSAFDMVAKVVHAAWPEIKKLIDILMEFSKKVFPILSRMFKLLLPLFDKVADVILHNLGKALPGFSKMVLSLAKTFLKLLGAVLPLVPSLVNLLAPAFEQIMGTLQKLWPQLGKILQVFITGMAPSIKQLAPDMKKIANAFVQMLPSLTQLIIKMTPTFLSAFTTFIVDGAKVLTLIMKFAKHLPAGVLVGFVLAIWGLVKAFTALKGIMEVMKGMSMLKSLFGLSGIGSKLGGVTGIAGEAGEAGGIAAEGGAEAEGVLGSSLGAGPVAALGAAALAAGYGLGTLLNHSLHLSDFFAKMFTSKPYDPKGIEHVGGSWKGLIGKSAYDMGTINLERLSAKTEQELVAALKDPSMMGHWQIQKEDIRGHEITSKIWIPALDTLGPKYIAALERALHRTTQALNKRFEHNVQHLRESKAYTAGDIVTSAQSTRASQMEYAQQAALNQADRVKRHEIRKLEIQFRGNTAIEEALAASMEAYLR